MQSRKEFQKMPLPMLTQPELISQLSEETGWTKSDVRQFLDALDTVITGNLMAGNRVKVAGIQVECKLRSKLPARNGRNPSTGESIKIAPRPASVVLKAKPVAPLSQIELPSVRTIQRMM
jgi:nucleoid DNA-binding protein